MSVRNRRSKITPPVLSADEIEMVRAAQRFIMGALDHPRVTKLMLTTAGGGASAPCIPLPPKTLKLIGQVLGMMSEGHTITLFPIERELSTTEAANLLNVSRPFLVKELTAGKIKYHMVGAHRRIAYEDLAAYSDNMKQNQHKALDRLAEVNRELGLEY